MKSVFIASPAQDVLASRLAQELALPLIHTQEISFADSEMRIMFADPDSKDLTDCHAIVVHATHTPVQDNLIWLLLTCYALRQHKVKKISAVIPYFGYARQTKNPDGTNGAAHAVIGMLESAGIEHLITVELHDFELLNSFSIPVFNVRLDQFIARFIEHTYETKKDILVAPDAGSHERVQAIAHMLAMPIICFQKDRYDVNKVEIVASDGTCGNACAIIIDDIIDTSSTIEKVAKKLQKGYSCCTVDAFGIHPVLSDMARLRLQQSGLRTIWVTNTIQLSAAQLFEKLQIIDISSELIKPLHEIL